MRASRVVALTSFCLLGCAATIPSGDTPNSPIELSITLRHNLPTVRVSVDGVALDLFLDLGGQGLISLTSEELAQIHAQYLSPPLRYQNVTGDVFVARRFVAPNVTIANHAFGALEGSEYVHPPSGGPPDRNGYVGKGLLTRYLLVLDYPNHHALLYDPGDLAAFRRECGSPQFEIADTDGAIATVGATAYGRLKFNWDTGATHNSIRIPAIGDANAAAARTVDDGPPVLELAAVTLGSLTIEDLSFRLSRASLPSVDATFGTGLFAMWKVCFDFVNGYGAVVRSTP